MRWSGNTATRGSIQATGGGVSGRIWRPRYQRRAEVPSLDQVQGEIWRSPRNESEEDFAGRGVPDISAYADSKPGYRTLVGGIQTSIGGTSAATPLWAALIARLAQGLGQPVGWFNRHLYAPSYRKAINPITRGDNRISDSRAASFSAREGWNGCCGLGTPNGEALLEALRDERAVAEGDD